MATELAASWPQLAGCTATLIKTTQHSPQEKSFEEYKESELSGHNSRLYQNKTEEGWRRKYAEYLDYRKTFWGCAYLNVPMNIYTGDHPSVIILSNSHGGNSYDATELKFQLNIERSLSMLLNPQYTCDVCTLVNPVVGDIFNADLNQPPKRQKMSTHLRKYKIFFDNKKYPNKITLEYSSFNDVAVFQISR